MEIVLATRNKDKIKEIKKLLDNVNVKILTFNDFPEFPIVEETGSTLRENALIKARAVVRKTGKISLADDSGLEVEVLGGKPGVFSSRFAGEDASYDDNNRKLLSLLKGIPEEKRSATFKCVMALVSPKGKELVVEGICRGRITTKPYGKEGFGYDPVFQPEGMDKTFAQLSQDEKNSISHRGVALRKLKEVLEEMTQAEGKFLIGLTGNMGCGKSTVASFLEKWGLKVIKADEVGHEILKKEKVKKEVIQIFGGDILNSKGEIIRSKIRGKIINNPEKLEKLNEVLHPIIKKEIWKLLTKDKTEIAVIEAALIFEAGWDFFLNKTIVVYCSKEHQIQRIKKATGMSLKEIEVFLKAQLPQEEKIKRADFVIQNDGDIKELEKRAREIFNKILVK